MKSLNNKKLNRDFFYQPTLTVAERLLGKILVFKNIKGIITEAEAYIGMEDPACHAKVGKTKRTEVMFGDAGFSYVYLIYGMYHCLNFVTESKNFPAAVLIRGIKIIEDKNNSTNNGIVLNGPGKLCKFLNITKEHNNVDIIESEHFYVEDNNIKLNFTTTPRIGIKEGTDKMWRFVIV